VEDFGSLPFFLFTNKYYQTKDYWEIGELEYKLAFEYDVVYETKKSYYDLFKAAGISWKKTTKSNPKTDPDAVAVKKKEIETLLENNRRELETGKLRALLIDECHLMSMENTMCSFCSQLSDTKSN
jgi:putative transposase